MSGIEDNGDSLLSSRSNDWLTIISLVIGLFVLPTQWILFTIQGDIDAVERSYFYSHKLIEPEMNRTVTEFIDASLQIRTNNPPTSELDAWAAEQLNDVRPLTTLLAAASRCAKDEHCDKALIVENFCKRAQLFVEDYELLAILTSKRDNQANPEIAWLARQCPR